MCQNHSMDMFMQTFSNFFKFFNSSAIVSKAILLQTAWHGIFKMLMTCFIYNTTFHQMISLDDAILHGECDIFHT